MGKIGGPSAGARSLISGGFIVLLDLLQQGRVASCLMPQVQLPIFPEHSSPITPDLAFERRDGRVVYFNGHLPVFTHADYDLASFRLFTSQLIQNGSATQSQIVAAFGVSLTTVKRYCKVLQSAGAAGFFVAPKPKSGHRLTPELLSKVQSLLDLGREVPQIGTELGVLSNTIHKAIRAGRLKKKRLA